MAAPYYYSAGTFASGTGALSVSIPAGYVAGDLFLLLVESANQGIATPSGWTETGSSPQFTGSAASAGGVMLAVFWKIASGSESAVAVADTGNHTTARIFCIKGAHDTTPIHATAGNSSSATTAITCPAVTTTRAECLIVNCIATDRDIAGTANFSGWTNAALTGLTEYGDASTSSGVGGGIAMACGTLAAAGSSGTTTVTQAASVTTARITLAIAPAIAVTTASGAGTTASTTAPTGESDNGTLYVSGELPASVQAWFSSLTADAPTVYGVSDSALYLAHGTQLLAVDSSLAKPAGGTLINLQGGSVYLRSVALSDDGALLLYAMSNSAYVTVVDTATGSVVASLGNGTNNLVDYALAINAAKTHVAVGTSTGVKVYELATNTAVTLGSVVSETVYSLAFGKSDTVLAVGRATGLTLYNTSGWSTITPAVTYTNSVYAVAFNHAGTLLAVGTNAGATYYLRALSTTTWDAVFNASTLFISSTVSSACFSKDDTYLAACFANGARINVYNTSTWGVLTTVNYPTTYYRHVAFSRVDNTLFALGNNLVLSVYVEGNSQYIRVLEDASKLYNGTAYGLVVAPAAFPKLSAAYGIRDDAGALCSRKVHVHDRSNGARLGATTATESGSFSIKCVRPTKAYAVFLDDDAGTQHNAEILGGLEPV